VLLLMRVGSTSVPCSRCCAGSRVANGRKA